MSLLAAAALVNSLRNFGCREGVRTTPALVAFLKASRGVLTIRITRHNNGSVRTAYEPTKLETHNSIR